MSAPVYESEATLDNALSEPTPGVIETMGRLEGDILVLGIAGKMGPTLARMAVRASESAGVKRRVMGASRFSAPGSEEAMQMWGFETFKGDLLNESFVENLPETPNVIYMAGMKFGATGNEPLTWAMNTYLPSVVCKRFRESRLAAFSTGNVYGLVPVKGGGSKEGDPPNPVGEYAMSCLGRERMFQYFSQMLEIPTVLIRLNYACELRYGVLVDIARKVWNGEPVDVSMGCFNVIWQRDANALSLQALEVAEAPARMFNLTGPEVLGIREVAEGFGKRFDKPVSFTGAEAESALINDASRTLEDFGKPSVEPEQMMDWIAEWIRRAGRSLGKPTHFESRDGKY